MNSYEFPVCSMLYPATSFDEECEDCGHPVRLHGDKYGCEYEYGDCVVPGESGASGSGY